MDVSLILTHRCNLACGYCYAGEHHKTDIEDSVLRRAVALLYSDGASHAQLSFFGGEPFLCFEAMQRATALAEAEAARLGKRLTLQCTTNGTLLRDERLRFVLDHGVRVTVSIDGVREAHDHNRPCAGGKPSFDQVHAGLRQLVDAGAHVDAMMVITPETASYLYLSANFLWTEGIETVRANLSLDAPWSDAARAELREQLVSTGWELLARRMRGEDVSFKPFERGIAAFAAAAEPDAPEPERRKVVVATSGNLYPCAPMVGEDRDGGREAALRLGHLDDGPEAIAAAVSREGVACERGKGCQCASYLETGSRYRPGPMGRWYARVCAEIGRTLAESLARAELAAPAPVERGPRRRRVLFGLAAIVGGAAVGAPLMAGLLSGEEEPTPGPCRLRARATEDLFPLPGAIEAPTLEPDPPPMIEGELIEPEPIVDGDMPAFDDPID